MPVELTSFHASCNSGASKCEWTTASEINNDYFSVERSTDEKKFIEVGKIKGAGNSSTMRYYEFFDYELPLSDASSTFYYRLKQTDFDGRQEYYGPVSVSCSSNSKWNLIFQNIIYDDELKGSLFLPEKSEINIVIVDLQGRIIKEEKLLAHDGSNFLRIELNDVEKGLYFIKVYNREKEVVKKFVKL